MNRKLYALTVIFITLAAVSTMVYFHPERATITPFNEFYSFIENKGSKISNVILKPANETTNKDSNQVEHAVDDETLKRFIKIYAQRDIDSLEIYEKEEVRYILESMGLYNVKSLKKLLNEEKINHEEILKLLNENLFEEQLMILNQILK